MEKAGLFVYNEALSTIAMKKLSEKQKIIQGQAKQI